MGWKVLFAMSIRLSETCKIHFAHKIHSSVGGLQSQFLFRRIAKSVFLRWAASPFFFRRIAMSIRLWETCKIHLAQGLFFFPLAPRKTDFTLTDQRQHNKIKIQKEASGNLGGPKRFQNSQQWFLDGFQMTPKWPQDNNNRKHTNTATGLNIGANMNTGIT